jgi:hypothetical protein
MYLEDNHPLELKIATSMSLGTVQLGSVGPSDHHAAAGLPTVGANTFPWRVPARKFLVYIYQKPLRS